MMMEMTKQAPTMPKAFARKVQALKAQRKRVERVSWNRICSQVWRDITDVTDSDAERSLRQRQLAKIGAQLAEVGVEPSAPQIEEQKLNHFMMILENEGYKRPTAT